MAGVGSHIKIERNWEYLEAEQVSSFEPFPSYTAEMVGDEVALKDYNTDSSVFLYAYLVPVL